MPMKAIATAIASALLACTAGTVAAQQLYRVVGPDGKVTFTDRAPSADTPAKTVSSIAGGGSTGANMAGLPIEVKQVVGKYPLTLYTSKDCGGCDSARSYLKTRGVPYTEKTITSNDEIMALQKMNGDGSVPFATLGRQYLKGFNENDWGAYLDAAGYPQSSQLPASYRQAGGTPLIPKVIQPAGTADSSAPSNGGSGNAGNAGGAPQRVTPDNPNGIIF